MVKRVLIACTAVFFCVFLSSPANTFELKTFGDITFGDSTKEGDTAGFTLGQLDLWATQTIDREERLKAFIELVIEHHNGQGFAVDLERAWVEYSIIPELQVRAGRFHTSLGYWNRIYHHGAHTQTTIFRPLFLDFEDGNNAILPTHIIGAMMVSNLGMRIGDLHLELQFGNGTSYNMDKNRLDPNNIADIDDEKQIATRVIFLPEIVDGLGMGFSFIANDMDKTTDTGAYTQLVNQLIYETDVFYMENNLELIFECYWIRNEDTSGIFRTSTVWYAQGGYAFFDMLTPYVRFEYFNDMDDADPYFVTLGATEYHKTVFGARFDIAVNSSVKIEGQFLDEPAGASEAYWLQWTFAF